MFYCDNHVTVSCAIKSILKVKFLPPRCLEYTIHDKELRETREKLDAVRNTDLLKNSYLILFFISIMNLQNKEGFFFLK